MCGCRKNKKVVQPKAKKTTFVYKNGKKVVTDNKKKKQG